MKKKKQNRKIYKTKSNPELEYMKIIKIAVGVILVLGLTWLVTAWASGEFNFGSKKEENEEVSIQYEEIIAGQIFNRVDSEYYVLLFNFTDTFGSYYLSLIDSYKVEEDSLPIYIVDLEKKVNEKYVLGEDEKLVEKPKGLSEFKATNPTLVKIKNGKVTERITGQEKVLDFFE